MRKSTLPDHHDQTRRKWVIASFSSLLLLVLGLGLGLGLYRVQASQRYTPRYTEVEVAKTALAICSGFSNQVSVTDPPTFRDEAFRLVPSGFHHRYLWFVGCNADGKNYQVMINDLTGKMICLMADDRDEVSRLEASTSSSHISTSDQAVSISVERLKELELVSPGTKIRLVRQPEKADDGHTWEVVWQVRHPDQHQTTRVKLLLDGHVGTPVIAVDHYELEKCTLN